MAMTSYQAAVKEGALENQRENILEIIRTRFQTVPSSLAERINTISARLKKIFNQSLTIDSPDEIQI